MDRNVLKEGYAKLCEEYLKAFCEAMGFEHEPNVWVAGEPGTIAIIGDYFFNFNDVIKYCVDNDLEDYDALIEWYDYSLWAIDFNKDVPTLRQWRNGFKPIPKEERDKWSAKKKELIDYCDGKLF